MIQDARKPAHGGDGGIRVHQVGVAYGREEEKEQRRQEKDARDKAEQYRGEAVACLGRKYQCEEKDGGEEELQLGDAYVQGVVI